MGTAALAIIFLLGVVAVLAGACVYIGFKILESLEFYLEEDDV